ncbi:cytochrome c oxidase subunit II [Natronocalculus amylovorans]|uniref:cytochrome-c oxidase n=1 Tax=Natronocalculus amylovorans TaxID=2917812 RepID=A0AAE3FYN6_9EURY|nr:cytochrome c oxidase subunit II [Natronocalculus amylovorans]MCL9817635.1 cytochrome c oxidase subunit II [Natronocalculus amylovorans]NUE02466.1 cytochrome c oxidase subunit II [Halorubraceae archaeon YAN]
MRAKRIALVSFLSVAFLALLAQPVAAQSVTADLINELNNKLLYVAIPITLLTQIILIYAVVKFRKNEEPKPTKENRRLEITWTVATAIILLFVGIASYGVMADENVTFTDEEIAPNENDVLVEAESYQWGWNMYYPEHDLEVGADEVVIPKDQDIYFEIYAEDVIHGFHVPELGLKMDAFPDQTGVLKTVVNDEGTYQGYCSEYCGLAHSQMYFTIEVVSQEEYDEWLEEQIEEQHGEDA